MSFSKYIKETDLSSNGFSFFLLLGLGGKEGSTDNAACCFLFVSMNERAPFHSDIVHIVHIASHHVRRLP